MSKTFSILLALIALTAGSANATPPAEPRMNPAAYGEDAYGVVVNTDGGTFDGVALIRAVQASAELLSSPTRMRSQPARVQRNVR